VLELAVDFVRLRVIGGEFHEASDDFGCGIVGWGLRDPGIGANC
jgi:hypothetical protein